MKRLPVSVSLIMFVAFSRRLSALSRPPSTAGRWRRQRFFLPPTNTASVSQSSTTTTTTTTRYTIEAPPIDSKLLQSTVYKNLDNWERYFQHRPVARHTADAFAQLRVELQHNNNTEYILDAGCGTGRSTAVLRKLYPQSIVIGIDRSVDRLSRTARELLLTEEANPDSEECWSSDSDDEFQDKKVHVQWVTDNGELE